MTLKVLAIDDSRTIRSLVQRAMEGAGFTCTTADDGVDGVARFAEVDPDVVELEVGGPGRGREGHENSDQGRAGEVRRPTRARNDHGYLLVPESGETAASE